MNVCKVPDMCKDMEYKYITEDSKTRVYLSVVREFNEAEYEKYYIRKKKEKVRKRILFIARALKYALPVLASTILYNMLSNKLYLERGTGLHTGHRLRELCARLTEQPEQKPIRR